jgi:predicted amidohydrolase
MRGFGEPGEPLAPVAEALDGAFVTGLSEAARKYGVTVVAGMFESVEDDTTRAYNTVVAVGADGDVIGRYRKVHLFAEPDRVADVPVRRIHHRCDDLLRPAVPRARARPR